MSILELYNFRDKLKLYAFDIKFSPFMFLKFHMKFPMLCKILTIILTNQTVYIMQVHYFYISLWPFLVFNPSYYLLSLSCYVFVSFMFMKNNLWKICAYRKVRTTLCKILTIMLTNQTVYILQVQYFYIDLWPFLVFNPSCYLYVLFKYFMLCRSDLCLW